MFLSNIRFGGAAPAHAFFSWRHGGTRSSYLCKEGTFQKVIFSCVLDVKSIDSILLAFSYSPHVQSCIAFIMANYSISLQKSQVTEFFFNIFGAKIEMI